MINYYIKNSLLYINGNEIQLDYKVAESISLNEFVIVRVIPPTKIKFNRNIFAFNSDGSLKWQIKESPHGGDSDKPFMGLHTSGNDVIASNWLGIDYKININNGEIDAIKFTR